MVQYMVEQYMYDALAEWCERDNVWFCGVAKMVFSYKAMDFFR